MRSSFRLYRRALTGSWLECYAKRAGFWTGVWSMALNNVVWVVVWTFFFDEVGSVRDWDGDRIRILLAVLATVAGFALGFLNNMRHLSAMAGDGRLDAVLTLPVGTLGYLLVRRVQPTGVGDLVFGIILFLLAGNPTPGRTLRFLVVCAAASAVLVGFVVIIESLSIRFGTRAIGEHGFQSILLFSFYPVDIFGSVARFVLYVVVPAGFVSAIPTRLLDQFDPRLLALEVLVGVAMVAMATVAFRWSLRSYTSGSGWTSA